MIVPDRILEQIEFVSAYVADCDDWVTVKKEIMRGLPSDLRRHFSTRNQKTKEQWLSEFDKIIIGCWYDVTGVKLKLRTIQERKDLDFLF